MFVTADPHTARLYKAWPFELSREEPVLREAVLPSISPCVTSSLLSMRQKSFLASLKMIKVADHKIAHAFRRPIPYATAGVALLHSTIAKTDEYTIKTNTGYLA